MTLSILSSRSARGLALATLDNELIKRGARRRRAPHRPLVRDHHAPLLPPPPVCRFRRHRRGRGRVRPAHRLGALLRRARSRIISTARASSTRTHRRRRASRRCSAGTRAARRRDWPEWAPSPYSDTPPARVDGPEWRLSYVGHASWLLQTAGLNILIDPVWSERVSPVSFIGPKRVNDPGHRVRRAAADRRRAGVALSLRPSRRRDAGAA